MKAKASGKGTKCGISLWGSAREVNYINVFFCVYIIRCGVSIYRRIYT